LDVKYIHNQAIISFREKMRNHLDLSS